MVTDVTVLTVGKPRVCWRLQGSGATVHRSGEIPEGQATVCSCTAQDQPPVPAEGSQMSEWGGKTTGALTQS